MAVKKRQCGTCRFFVQSDTPGFGTCTNPAWPESSAPLLLLRPNELACRTRWGTSLWQDPSDTSEPGIAAAPQQPSLPEPPSVQLQYDDEVTSVSIADSFRTKSSLEDDVVDTSSVISASLAWDDELQTERRELLRQSPQDALAGARKRHMDKQARQRELIPFAEDDQSTTVETTSETPLAADASEDNGSAFTPDDFVEEERGTADSEEVFDDELVDEGLPGGRRSPRLNHLLRKDVSPKSGKAMTTGAASEMTVTAHNPENREQWNTVPQIQPGFDLPLSTPEESPAPTGSLRVSASAAPSMAYTPPSRPMSVAREVITEDRKQIERAQRRVEVPLADDLESQKPAIDARTKLTHAPSNQAAIVERLKASPLRGYHPTPKPTAQAPQRQVEVRPRRDVAGQARASADHRSHPQVTDTVVPKVPHVESREPSRSPQQPPVSRATTQQVVDTAPFESEEIEIARGVPIRCGTCASYRPSDVAGRGSCANQFAGPVQRVVSASDLACEHTYGSLWIPADHVIWLKKLPDHSGPTPRVDAMIARRERRQKPVLPDIDELTS